MQILSSLKERAKELKQFTLVAYFEARDPRTPVHVRILALLVAAYALSPIDFFNLVVELAGGIIVVTWRKLEPWLHRIRLEQSQPSWAEWFQWQFVHAETASRPRPTLVS